MYVVDGGRPSVYTVNRHGVISALYFDDLTPGAEAEIDVPLPAGTVAVAGVGASLTIESAASISGGKLAFGDVTKPIPEPANVVWWWELAAETSTGQIAPLESPSSWRVTAAPTSEGSGINDPEIVAEVGAFVMSADIDPRVHRGNRVPFLFSCTLPEGDVIPAIVTSDLLGATGASVGERMVVRDIEVRVIDTISVLPGTADGSGLAVDLSWLSMLQFASMVDLPRANELWLAASATNSVAERAAEEGLQIADRAALTRQLLEDPMGQGVLNALWAAAVAGALLATFGLAVDSRANAVRRGRELAILHTLGASPGSLARGLMVEQSVLAGMGVLAGVAVGVGVAAAMGTSLVLTLSGNVPLPEPLLAISPVSAALPAVGLLAVALMLGALAARHARYEVVAGALRIGEE